MTTLDIVQHKLTTLKCVNSKNLLFEMDSDDIWRSTVEKFLKLYLCVRFEKKEIKVATKRHIPETPHAN